MGTDLQEGLGGEVQGDSNSGDMDTERVVEAPTDTMGLVGPFGRVTLTLDEAWAIRDLVRQHQVYGAPWDKQDMAAVHSAILFMQGQGQSCDILIDEGTLWQIESQIPSDLMIGTEPTGRNILLKVMHAIRGLRQGAIEALTEEGEVRKTPLISAVEHMEEGEKDSEAGFEAYLKAHNVPGIGDQDKGKV